MRVHPCLGLVHCAIIGELTVPLLENLSMEKLIPTGNK